MTQETSIRYVTPFNGPIEIGLRALSVLNDAFSEAYSLQRLIIFDYLLVHSDDMPGGPLGLHPKTPHRGGELLVRRNVLQEGLLLYQSRGLVERVFMKDGIFYVATEHSAGFLDSLRSAYVQNLRDRAAWVVDSFGQRPEMEIEKIIHQHIGEWGAEFEMESVLWMEESS